MPELNLRNNPLILLICFVGPTKKASTSTGT